MVPRLRIPVLLLAATLLLLPCSPADAGAWKSFKKFCSSVGSAAKGALDAAGDGLKHLGAAAGNLLLAPVNLVTGQDVTVTPEMLSFSSGKGGKKTPPVKVSPEILKKLQSCHVISANFDIAGKTFGDGKQFTFRVDQPGVVECRIQWTGAPALAMILNGPDQVSYYDRIDGSSPLYFSFKVTPELVKKGSLWKISIKDFSKSNRPSKVNLVAFTPRRIGETIAAATTDQRAGFAEQDIRGLAERVKFLENQLRLEKEFTRSLHRLIKQLRTRINAIDHKDDGLGKG